MESKRAERISVMLRFTSDEDKIIETAAKEAGKPKATFIREFLLTGLDKEQEKANRKEEFLQFLESDEPDEILLKKMRSLLKRSLDD